MSRFGKGCWEEKSSLDVWEGVEKPLGSRRPFPSAVLSSWPLSSTEPRQDTPLLGAFLPTQNSCGVACALEKGEAECEANLLAGSSFPCRAALASAGRAFVSGQFRGCSRIRT